MNVPMILSLIILVARIPVEFVSNEHVLVSVKNEKQQLSDERNHHCSYQMISRFLFIHIIDKEYDEALEETSNSYSDLLFSSAVIYQIRKQFDYHEY
jgi:hypothetical protein